MNIQDLLKISKIRAIKFTPVDLKDKDIDGGIYRMFNDSGEIIYVGKSNNLKRRIHQHLGRTTNTTYFMDEVKRIEWHEEPDPVFETLLESIFIAFYRPKYNDEVKDSKKKFGEDYDPRQ